MGFVSSKFFGFWCSVKWFPWPSQTKPDYILGSESLKNHGWRSLRSTLQFSGHQRFDCSRRQQGTQQCEVDPVNWTWFEVHEVVQAKEPHLIWMIPPSCVQLSDRRWVQALFLILFAHFHSKMKNHVIHRDVPYILLYSFLSCLHLCNVLLCSKGQWRNLLVAPAWTKERWARLDLRLYCQINWRFLKFSEDCGTGCIVSKMPETLVQTIRRKGFAKGHL